MTADVLKAGCKWVLFLSLVLLLPAGGYAQEATFTGTVTDSIGAVLPGATITAIHDASGNTFTAVTDGRGEFRLPVRVGNFRIAVELPGFTTVNRSLEILLGQTVSIRRRPPWARTSTRGRCRSCRSTGATGWT
ncbi:MAG: carboxypeptidase regulatory-like domain-containing protein [Acidobacteria bacterium]|nr:carboxypeptidase regulatory-like domain-containing protein [Acidobacteriota bacterium]